MSAHPVSERATTTLPPRLRAGHLLGGRYEIERWLGGGGMASVYRALHTGLDQPVAVKVVSPHVRELPGIVLRFMREARAATRLKGEHVVRVFDVGTADDGSPYLAMELLEGKDLGAMLDEGFKPTLEEAIDYTLQACDALAEVHGLGIVHRDLKPANLFVTRGPDGLACLKLIDFGISRVDSPLWPKDAVALTSPEIVMGSPRYMPPEQMESAAAADSRSDIWGLGAILYEMLAGDAPFDGTSLWDIYAAAVRSPPRLPSACRPGLPEELDQVVLKCLRVNPAQRYADVADLAVALAPFGDESAAARAESIVRVLEASRARGHGEVDAAITTQPSGKGSPSSRIRPRGSPASRAVQRERLAAFGATALLVGIGLAAGPISRTIHRVPGLAVTGAAAAAATTNEPKPPAESPPPPEATTPAPPAEATSAPPPAATAPARAIKSPAPPRWSQSPARRRAPEVMTSPEPTTDLAPEPASRATSAPARPDDRQLFEDRK